MYYSDHDVLELIARIEKPYESEVIELKEAKSDFSFKDLGKYFSALSNEAILRGKQDAWLIFGMDDDKVACGTSYREGNPANLRSLKKEIADRANNRLTLREIHELRIDGQTRPRISNPRCDARDADGVQQCGMGARGRIARAAAHR